jgi:hypothetical protein
MNRLALLFVLLLTACGAGASGPEGLYLMTRFAFGNLEMKTFQFGDGGVLLRNPVGPDVQPAGDKGTYAVADGVLTMNIDGRDNKAKLEPGDGGCFGWDGGIFCPARPFDSDTLDGTFSGGASVGGGAVMSSTTITFQPDGTYPLSGVGSVAAPGAGAGSAGGETGNYTLDGTTLTLQPAGGAARSYSTFPYDDGTEGAQPRRVYFGGGMLKRIEKK